MSKREPHTEGAGYLKEAVTLWKVHTVVGSVAPWREESILEWSRFAGRTCYPVENSCWSSLIRKNCTLWTRLRPGQLLKNCSPWEGLILQQFIEKCLLWEGPSGVEEKCFLPDGEEAVALCDELTTAPISLHCWGMEVEKILSEVKSIKKGRVEGRCFFKIWAYFH